MDRQLVKISKFLSLVLRHHPGKIGLTLDAQGWADADELLAKANQHGVALTRSLLQEVVAQNDKQRFAFYCAANGVWLTRYVPSEYLVMPS